MKNWIANTLWLAIAFACGTAFAADTIRWSPDLPSARQAAEKYKVPLVIHFYGDNCLPCRTLEERVFTRPELIETLNKYFICVRINASVDRESAAKFGVHSWPTDVFVSGDGEVLYQGVCKQDLNGYLGVLQSVAEMNRDRNTMLVARQQSNAPVTESQLAAQQSPAFQSSTAPLGANRMGPNGSASPTTPGFYNAPQQQMSQQLQAGLSPNSGVTAGPINVANQVQAITGSQSMANHMAQTSPAPTLGQPGHSLAPSTQPGGSHIRTGPANSQQLVTQFQGMPNQSPNAQTAPNRASQFGVHANAADSQMVSNPYYPQPAAAPAAQASVPQMGSQQLPAQTVAFQPRRQTQAASEPRTPNTPPAFEGYCPVEAKSNGNWIAGKAEFAVKHRGQVYWLSSEAARAQFLQAPDNSSPVLSGFDPMIFLSEGKLVPGSIQFNLHEQVSDELFLFTSEQSKQAYHANFENNTRALKTVMAKAEGK